MMNHQPAHNAQNILHYEQAPPEQQNTIWHRAKNWVISVCSYIFAPWFRAPIQEGINHGNALEMFFGSRLQRHFNNDAELMTQYDTVLSNIREHQYQKRALARKHSYLKSFAEKIEKRLSDPSIDPLMRDWSYQSDLAIQSASIFELSNMFQEITAYNALSYSNRGYVDINNLIENENLSEPYRRKVENYLSEYIDSHQEVTADLMTLSIGPKKGWLYGFYTSVFDRVQSNAERRNAEDLSLEEAERCALNCILLFTRRVSTEYLYRTQQRVRFAN